MQDRSVTFATNVWENDWQAILTTDRLGQSVKRCGFSFADRLLMINNVSDMAAVRRAADSAVEAGTITRVVAVDEHAEAALQMAGLTRAGLDKGYLYSIPPLVGLLQCRTAYFLYFTGDTIVAPDAPPDWLDRALDLLEARPDVKAVNLTWNRRYRQAARQSVDDDADFWFSRGFSDQMFLVRAAELRAPVYDHYHPAVRHFPERAGEPFEKRVAMWLRATGGFRATYRHGAYLNRTIRPGLESDQI